MDFSNYQSEPSYNSECRAKHAALALQWTAIAKYERLCDVEMNSNDKSYWLYAPIVNLLPDALWSGENLSGRSQEVTVVCTGRHFCPRDGRPGDLHDFWELGIAVQGHCELVYKGGERLALSPGVAFMIPPRLDHAEQSRESCDIIFIGLKGSLLATYWDATTVTSTTSLRLIELGESLWLHAATHRNRPIGLLLDAMAHMLVAVFQERLSQNLYDSVDDKLSSTLEYMERHLAEPLSVEILAGQIGVSCGHFNRIFKKQTGKTPLGHLVELRMRQATQLLKHSHLPLSEIARHCGYADPYYFSRAFHREVGCCPQEYRRRIRSEL